ncbi:methylglyoxal reductase [Enterococcus sp. 665A]|uniref:Methylglyoxal reductase n=2 Tax=Candidatus Enterococcus ferrettii TaxID=2815324 RepID=A0ABV0ESR6_9ENTE
MFQVWIYFRKGDLITIMKLMKLGSTKVDISRIGLGTWAIGGGPAWGRDNDERDSINTIKECPDLGVNLIDTAPGYNFGNSESVIGKALAEVDREKFIIITKCGIVWKRKGSLFNKVGDRQLYKNLSRESIMEEVEESLERLQTDYIDVYMTHWQAVEPYYTPISEVMSTLTELKQQGKIRAIGVANASVDQVKEYLKHGKIEIVQAKYSILDREVENELLHVCRENNVTLQAYSPLEQGLLTGCLDKSYQPVGAQVNKKWFQKAYMSSAIDMMASWKKLEEKYDCTTANLALAWVLAQSPEINLLSGATTTDQIQENVRACTIELADEDIAFMRKSAEEAEVKAVTLQQSEG